MQLFGRRGKVCFFAASLLLLSVSARAEQASEVERRILCIEQEIRRLQEENDHLQDQVRALKEQLESQGIFPSLECVPQYGPVNYAFFPYGTSFSGGFDDGFVIASDERKISYRLGGSFKTRFRAVNSGHPLDDEFSIKRARLETEAVFEDYFLRTEVEFVDPVKIKDAYIEYRPTPKARLRLGQFIVPFTLEAHLTKNYSDFAEGSIAATNMYFGARDIGAMLNGRLWDDLVRYRVAVLNGTGENKGDSNDSKDVAARLVLHPLRNFGNQMFSYLALGASGTFGEQDTDYSAISFKTSAGTEFVDFAEGAVHRGNRARLGTELVLPYGPACVKAEWMRMWLTDFEKPPVDEDLRFLSWYVSGSFLVTGENKCLSPIVPNRPFDPFKGGWGALEIVARYAQFRSDHDLFACGLAAGTDRAQAVTLGLNWYFNEFARATLNYERTEFDDPVAAKEKPLDDENVYIVQFQLEF